jgi:hypothetical protein
MKGDREMDRFELLQFQTEALQLELDSVYGIRYWAQPDMAGDGVDILDIDGNHLEFFTSVSDARKKLLQA